MKQRIDRIIREAVEGFGNRYFTKPEIMNLVVQNRTIVDILTTLRRVRQGWPLDEMLSEYIQRRLDVWLDRKMVVAQLADGPVRMRIYECYPVGEGSRRWRRLEAMTATDLRICIAERRRQVASHQRVIRVYEALLVLLERLPATTTVADIVEQGLQDVAAAQRNP